MPQQITPAELAEQLKRGEAIYLLDVRLPEEQALAVLPGTAKLLPLQELPHRLGEIVPPPGALVVAYCHHGVRSWHAAAFLEERGLGPALSLAGGIDAWSREVDPGVPRY